MSDSRRFTYWSHDLRSGVLILDNDGLFVDRSGFYSGGLFDGLLPSIDALQGENDEPNLERQPRTET